MRERARTLLVRHGIAEGGVLLAILGWWLTARGMPEFVLPSPVRVAETLTRFVTEPVLLGHLAITFLRVAAAVAIAMALAVALAVAARRSRLAMAVIEQRLLLILNSFPSVGWAILGIIWFQVSNTTVIFIETAIVLPFCLVNAIRGSARSTRNSRKWGEASAAAACGCSRG